MGKSKSQLKSASSAFQRMPVGSPLTEDAIPVELQTKTKALESLQRRFKEKEVEIAELEDFLNDKDSRLESLQRSFRENEMEIVELKNSLNDKDCRLKKVQDIADSCLVQWCWLGPSAKPNYFSKEASWEIESACKCGSGTMTVHSGSATYEINFSDMTQTNIDTGKVREIRRSEIEYDKNPNIEDVVLRGLAAEAQVLALTASLKDAEEKLAQEQTAKCRAEQAMCQAEEERKRADQQVEEMKAMLAKTQQEVQRKSQGKEQAEQKVEEMKAMLAKTQEEMHRMSQGKQESEQEVVEMEQEVEEMEHKMQLMARAHLEQVSLLEEALRQIRAKPTKDLEVHYTRRLKEITALWRMPKPFLSVLVDEPLSTQAQICNVFKTLSHSALSFQGLPSRCSCLRNLKILSAQVINSLHLWQQYTKCKEELKAKHQALGFHVQPLAWPFDGLDCLLPHRDIDSSLNEVILLHGCSEEAAKAICRTGWDIRYTNTNGGSMYGEGMYFGRQPCKCHQYTSQSNPRYMIISRVALGDPAYLDDKFYGRLPPPRDAADPQKGLYDSSVVNPDISRCNQSHWEYVIYDGKQAYPEMLIKYEV